MQTDIVEKDILTKEFIKVKRELFEKYYCNLNDKQREAIFSVNGPVLVLAGAGSGKTTVLVNRIAHILRFSDSYEDGFVPSGAEKYIPLAKELLKNGTHEEIGELLSAFSNVRVRPYNILCLTFTNKAAGEFKNRLAGILGESANDIWAGTFHSICVRILRRDINAMGCSSSFNIYDTDDTKRLITKIMKEADIKDDVLPVKTVTNEISRLKEKGILPEDYSVGEEYDEKKRRIALIYTEYMKHLQKLSALDFDDLILYTIILFEKHPEILEQYRRKFDYIFADEYQDTNPSQSKLLHMLTGDKRNIFVVGDDDQSIYSFRGATIKNILEFDKTYPEAKVIKLEQNYRSTQTILSAANAVIGNNIDRKGKNLWTSSGDGDKIVIHNATTQSEEAMFITEHIAKAVASGEKLSEIAVLYRTNAQSASIESALAKAKIPYRIYGGLRFYERKEVKDIVAYLSVMTNPSDDLRLLRIINQPKRGLGNVASDKLISVAAENGISLFEAASHADEFPELDRCSQKLYDFCRLIADLNDFSRTHTLAQTVYETTVMTGYADMINEHRAEDGRDRAESINELIAAADAFEKEYGKADLVAFLEDIALVSDIDDYETNEETVSLMTVHNAKGLEFSTVFLPGFEEGLFPGRRSMDTEEGLEEERRLAYVAVTRAKKQLYIIHAENRTVYGKTEYCHPSRFIKEIPDELVIHDRPNRNHILPRQTRPRPDITRRLTTMIDEADTGVPEVRTGDRVMHAIFGKGVVVSAQPIGNDKLLEVEFFSGTTKKLMQNYAKLKILS